MNAYPPVDQADRLRELQDFEILDTDPEQAFDDVVALASRICGMPMSLISLVDVDRQWFKASVGLEEHQTPLEKAICAHAIQEDDFLEIEDTTLDPRTLANPLVTGAENLRYYAGAVLRSSAGFALGTLCVLDTKPNRLTDLQRDTLRVLARQVMAQLELRRALREADLLRREVDHRVKNSLQSVAALTRVQARMVTSPEAKEALDLVRRRIDTIALLHEQLYGPNAADRIQLDTFIPRVAALLQQAAPEGVRIETTVEPMSLASSHAAAVGVILNEFAANAFKHAFPDGRSGIIRFALAPDGPEHAVLACMDDGIGIADTSSAAAGLGLKIIEASAQQLGGLPDTTTSHAGTTTLIRITRDTSV